MQFCNIKQFCCGVNAFSFGVDMTFILCDKWLTDTCYRNKRVINSETRTHPIFPGVGPDKEPELKKFKVI